jgi:hypothetical protein
MKVADETWVTNKRLELDLWECANDKIEAPLLNTNMQHGGVQVCVSCLNTLCLLYSFHETVNICVDVFRMYEGLFVVNLDEIILNINLC